MQLEESYEILDYNQSGGIVVGRARDLKSQKLVQIHLFPAQAAQDAKDLRDLLPSLPIPELAKIIRFGKDGNWSYLITEPLPEGQNIRDWIRQTARIAEIQDAQPVSTPALPDPTFKVTGERSASTGQPRPLSPGDSLARTKQAAGDFTRIYGKSDWAPQKQTQADAAPAQPERPAPPSGKAEPGLNTFIGLKPPTLPVEPVSEIVDWPLSDQEETSSPVWSPEVPPNTPSLKTFESPISFDYSSRELRTERSQFGPRIAIRSLDASTYPATVSGPIKTSGLVLDWKIVLASTAILLTVFLTIIALVER